MPNPNTLNEAVGLLRRGWIQSYDQRSGKMSVKLNTAPISSANSPVSVQGPHSLFYNNGLFVGTKPFPGTPVVVGQGSGGEYFFVSFLAENIDNVPNVKDGQLLITSNELTKISLDTKSNIYIGSDGNKIHINTDLNYMSRNFSNDYKFTQAGRKIEGVVKRDLIRNTNFDQDSKLESNRYEQEYFIISMDPSATSSPVIAGSEKNPAFVESREMIYEFQNQSGVQDDLSESSIYADAGTKANSNFTYLNRRVSRADTLSLSLVAPNYLMEQIKGTVVDIFGNILDLNRNPLPFGQDQNTINPEKSTDKVQSFFNIRALERKSLAYHFEINARKDLTGRNGQIQLPDITSNEDYARDRSRFFIDIDKEGQFKINVPASSEKGNIPLLTRYENYSTYGPEDSGNPNKIVELDNKQDIFHDSFASPSLTASSGGFLPSADKGSITLKTGDGADAAPQDRITGAHIKHGMVYHDIMQTCFTHQSNDFLKYQLGEMEDLTINLDTIPELTDIASDIITVSGDSADAGGRSGSINLDGSIELNIGANTIDRQSLWMSLAGGMVSNIGRDINGRSVIASTGGDFFLQVGGFGITGDSRFEAEDNGIKGAVLDLRVLSSGGYTHMIRIDDTGISIMSPSDIKIHSGQNMSLTCDQQLKLEGATVVIQERAVLKTPGISV